MKFDAKRTAFGRHQTFALRYGWLPKGFQAVVKNPDIFSADHSTVKLGVGKNMVESIRHWLRAAQLTDRADGKDQPTRIGRLILDEEKGVDPFLEDEATLWLIHWLIASNPHQATAWYWFFNCFQRVEFTAEEVVTSLSDFVKERIPKSPADGTLKGDAMMVLRMYRAPNAKGRMAYEDSIDAPLALLGLVSQVSNNRIYQSKPSTRPGLPDAIIAYALAQVVEDLDGASAPIEELMYSDNARISLGGVFRLTESEFLARLERICAMYPGNYEIRDTAGISQLYILEKPEAEACLMAHYKPTQKVAA